MKIAALGAVAGLAVAATAQAGVPWDATETHMASFGGPMSPYDDTATLPQFDEMGGQRELVGVCMTYDLSISAQVTAENDSVLPAPDFAVNLSGFATISFGGLSDTVGISTGASFGVGPTDNGGMANGMGPDFHDFGLLSDTANGGDDVFFFPLAQYIGNGTIDATIHAEAGFSVSGTTDSTIQTTMFGASGTVTIEYKYTIIPTPGTAAILGLAGIAGIRRRR